MRESKKCIPPCYGKGANINPRGRPLANNPIIAETKNLSVNFGDRWDTAVDSKKSILKFNYGLTFGAHVPNNPAESDIS